MNPTSVAAPARAVEALSLPCLGRWRAVRLLGAGNFTRVYQARPVDAPAEAPADYALKVAAPRHECERTANAMLRREACVARQVSHAHLVGVLGAQLDESPGYLVLPYLRGATLGAVLASGRLPRVPHLLWIARQTAEALAALHAQGWLHGDVKPDNILIAPNGHVTLLDLGFARRIAERPGEYATMGTPRYLAPECLVQGRACDGRADLYSLGILLFESLTGRVPFPDESEQGLALAHLRQKPADVRAHVPQLPMRLSRLVRRLLAKEPLRRPSASETIELLAAVEIETLHQRAAA